MIDTDTGLIKINYDLQIHPKFIFEEFKKSSHYKGEDVVRVINLAEKQEIDGRKYFVSLFFKDFRIHVVSLVNCDQKLSHAEEQARKLIHDKILLANNIEAGKEYMWGKITSDFDQRDTISSINIYYK